MPTRGPRTLMLKYQIERFHQAGSRPTFSTLHLFGGPSTANATPNITCLVVGLHVADAHDTSPRRVGVDGLVSLKKSLTSTLGAAASPSSALMSPILLPSVNVLALSASSLSIVHHVSDHHQT
ncbi:hypothetical protein CGCF413_v003165 [Colletotrichum fructicola]|nr:hypothetical protein CGCF413_v003165 [Colletotrichum fructicola]